MNVPRFNGASDEDARRLTVRRIAAGVTVAVNLATEPQDVPVSGTGEVVLGWPGDIATGVVGGAVRLPTDGVVVVVDA